MINFNIKNFSSLKVYEFNCEKCLVDKTLYSIKEMEYRTNEFNKIGINRLNDLEEFKDLHEWFQKCVDTVFTDLNLPESFKNIKITESWGNKSSRGEHHHFHTHPNSYLSAIFYLTSNSSGFTKFMTDNMWYSEPHLFASHIGHDYFEEHNIFSQTPESGKLLIFPSRLQHYVEPNNGDDVRYTISFNAYPEIYDDRSTVYISISVKPFDRKKIENSKV
jgi:uncharacterized protein (TIGR02466 family)